jgi:predicted acylesterase/phospholipase RssA
MTTEYGDGDFANPASVCDVIMKGGITSGVVYPRALTELAKQFRFAQVGGTSAGAIAAAAAAAAEYGRHVPGGGFVLLAKLPAEVGNILFSLFQPIPALKPVFDILVAAIGAEGTMTKVMRVIVAALAGFPYAAAAGALPGLLIVVAGWWHANLALTVLGALLLLIGITLGIALCLYRAITKGIPDNDFGLCPGKTQPGYSTPGLSDWLGDKIDEIAGRDPKKDPPLTFGDLSLAEDTGISRHKITLRMMTTNLTLRRPYSLPFTEANEKIFAFRLADFERLFPARITSYLAAHCEKVDDSTGECSDLYKFPEAENLPVIVATRMSLSFPLLFCAVPLYARDFTFASEAERAKWRKHLFSDGGLSNNFPIQFFDRMLPNSPTFGITLDDFNEKRVPEDIIKKHYPANDPHVRVWLPKTTSAGSGVLIPGEPLHGIAAFFSRLLDAAMSWQDNLQSTLPGYRDRIVHVGLKSDEGGLNITMPQKLVDRLACYGALAGEDMRDEFDLDEHRWRRFLVAMDRMDHTLDEIAAAYNGQGGIESFAAFLNRYPYPPNHPVSYKDAARDHLETLKSRAADLAELSRRWEAQLQIPGAELPHPKTDLRITPRP